MVKITEAQCTYCNEWFPSPISLGSQDVLDNPSMMFQTVKVDCPNCGERTIVNKINMRLTTNTDPDNII